MMRSRYVAHVRSSHDYCFSAQSFCNFWQRCALPFAFSVGNTSIKQTMACIIAWCMYGFTTLLYALCLEVCTTILFCCFPLGVGMFPTSRRLGVHLGCCDHNKNKPTTNQTNKQTTKQTKQTKQPNKETNKP